jgi:putative transposase
MGRRDARGPWQAIPQAREQRRVSTGTGLLLAENKGPRAAPQSGDDLPLEAGCQGQGRAKKRLQSEVRGLPAREDGLERAMLRLRRMHRLLKLASVHSSVHNRFDAERSLSGRPVCAPNRAAAVPEWRALRADWHGSVSPDRDEFAFVPQHPGVTRTGPRGGRWPRPRRLRPLPDAAT